VSVVYLVHPRHFVERSNGGVSPSDLERLEYRSLSAATGCQRAGMRPKSVV
jgi:hypothetical protein